MPANLFDIPQDDQSIYFLGQIFGNVGGVFPTTADTLFLGAMFQTINTIALTVGAIIVVYTTIVGMMQTAHEGEFLGKKWNSLWVPIRMVIGVASLFPSSAGYSAIQIVIMWIIVQGVGAADMVWESAINYVNRAGSPFGGLSSMSTEEASELGVDDTLSATFQGLVCQQLATQKASGDDVVKYYTGSFSPPAYTAGSYAMGPNASCGTLQTCDKAVACTDSNSLVCWACEGQEEAMRNVMGTLTQIAQTVVQFDTQYVSFYNTEGAQAPDWIQSFCKYNNIDEKLCCVKPVYDRSGLVPVLTNPCSPDKFPSTFDTGTPPIGTNISKSGMKMYQDYAIYPYLMGSPGALVEVDTSADFIKAATASYVSAINNYVASKKLATPPPTSTLEGWQQDAVKYGWISAGSFFYRIAQTAKHDQEAVNPTLKMVEDVSTLPSSPMSEVRNNYTATQWLFDSLASIDKEGPTAPAPVASIDTKMSKAGSEVMRGFMQNLTCVNPNQSGEGATSGTLASGGNELRCIASFGQKMMVITQVLYSVIILAAFLSTFSSTINGILIGTGLTLNPFGEAVKVSLSVFTPVFYALLSALFTFGAMLGIYIPMIPYVVFTVTALGWLIATIEAMVAAPIIAIGILSPGGQSEVFGKAEPAVMILFNLFLRPTLMVFGLMASMMLAMVAVKLVNMGFLRIMGDIMLHPGMVEQFVFIATYVSLIFVVMNKVFTLIHLIPERVLTYIGGTAIQYGEAEAAGGVKQGVEAAAAGAAMGMKGGAQGATSGLESLAKAKAAEAEKKKGDKNTVNVSPEDKK